MQTPMRRARARWIAPVLAAACLALLATSQPAAAGSRYVTHAKAADALDGRLVLTRCKKSICRLYTSVAGSTHRLPIRQFPIADDPREADLGIGPQGHEVVAYPRCSGSVRDCDLYIYDFATGKQRRLPVSSRHGGLTNPTVSGNRVAYGFNPRGRDGPSKRFHIYWSRLGSRKMHRAATMPFHTGSYLPTLDLAGKRLAYSGYSALTSCLDQSQVRITKLGKSHRYGRLIARGTNWTDVFSPIWAGNRLYFGRDRFTRPKARHDFVAEQIAKSRLERHLPGMRSNQTARYRKAAMQAVLPHGERLMYQADGGKRGRTGVYDAGTPSFRAVARPR